MTWTPLDLSPDGGVAITVNKARVVVTLAPVILHTLGWGEEDPNVSVSLGDEAHAGWLRVALDEDGFTPDLAGSSAVLTLPRSLLPDLQNCRRAPLSWKKTEPGTVEIRLPTVASARPVPRRSSPRLVATGGGQAAATPVSGAADEETGVDLIAVPDLYQALHAEAWRAGVELAFLSDGNAMVNGRVMDTDEMEKFVRARIKAA